MPLGEIDLYPNTCATISTPRPAAMAAANPIAEPVVKAELGVLEMETIDLIKIVEHLRERLAPVSVCNVIAADAGGPKPRPVLCPVAERVNDSTARVKDAINRISELIDALQV